MSAFLKKHRVLAGIALAVLAAAVALPLALLSASPTMAGILADNPIGDIPGTLDMDVSALNWTTQKFQHYNDNAWSGNLNTRTYPPTGSLPQGSSGYFNVYSLTNPTATPQATLDHVLFFPPDATAVPPRVARVGFYGYYAPCWFDYVYTEDYNIYDMNFDIFPSQWNFHCLKRIGFFFKCKKNPVTGALTGYMFSIGGNKGAVAAAAGTANGLVENTDAADQCVVSLFYVDNIDIDNYNNAVYNAVTNTFKPLPTTFGNPNITMAQTNSYTINANNILNNQCRGINGFAIPGNAANNNPLPVQLIQQWNPGTLGATTPQMHIRIHTDKNSFGQDIFEIYLTPNSLGVGPVEHLVFSEVMGTGGRITDGRGFGLYMQNRAHGCAQLTATEFRDFGLKVENEDPTPVHAQVNYKIFGTSTQIDTPDTQTSILGSSYTVDPLTYCRKLVSGGKTYYYFSASRTLYESDGVTPLEFEYEEDDPLDPGNAPPENTIDLYYVEEPTIQKNANILRNDGSGGYTADPGNPHNGTPQVPFEIEYNDRIEYEITISNPNLAPLAGVPMQIIDTVPHGMKYISSSPSVVTPITTNARGQEVLKWDIVSIPASGSLTFKVVVEVVKYGLVYVNGADLFAPDTGLNVSSNRVYHTSSLAPLDAQKDARIKDPVSGLYPGSPSNGTSGSRVELGRDDTLKYTIGVTNPNPPYQGPSYDIIYNLDWSGSMSSPSNAQDYRLLAKDVALKFSRKVFDNYPDSRVALMGTNAQASHSLSGQKEYFFLEVESDFYADWQYTSAFDSIYPASFVHSGDDMPLGLQASIEKLLGDDSNVYGGAPVDGPFPAVGVRQLDYPRLDLSRIPVIIQLSDWELDVPSGGGNFDPNFGNPTNHVDPTLRPAWTRMRDQLTNYKNYFGDGVFIGVSFPGGNSTGPAGNRQQLIDAVAAIEPTPNKWGTVQALATHSADDLADLLWDEFTRTAPLYPHGCTVTDTLPEGLVTSVGNVTVSPPAAASEVKNITVTVDSNGQYVVEVEFDNFPEGTFAIDIICTVAGGELTKYELDNKATISYEHGGNTYGDETNTTYHKIPTYNVTTRWAEYSSPTAVFLPGHADRVDPIIRGNTYYIDDNPATGDLIDILYTKPGDTLRTFEYYGYATSTDGGVTYSAVTTGPPPGAGFTVNSNLIIVLYFRTTYQIVEKFHDDASPYLQIFPDGSPITVYSGDNWDPASHATAIPPIKWIAGYPYTYDTSANHYKQELDTNPVKTPRTTGYTNIHEDHVVIYPYTKGQRTDFVVTETFRKFTDPTQRVNATTNPDILTNVPGGDDFDLAAGIPPKDIGSYTYVGYNIDGGTIEFGMPPAPPDHLLEYVTDDHDIAYFYAELATKTAQVYHGGIGAPDPEDTGTLMVPVIALPGDDILYIVKLTIPEGLAQTGSVTVTDELPKGLSTDNTKVSHGGVVSYNATTERYTVTWTIPFPTTPAPSGTLNLTARAAVVTRATYVNEAEVTLNDQNYIDTYTTNFTVHDHVLPGAKTLHIRQIILARSPGTTYAELPPVGFFTAANGGTSTSLLSTSGLWGYGATPFTIYTFPESVDLEYFTDNLVPQHYEWKDYELTIDPAVAHDRTHLSVGRPALLDYQDEREYWLTVYLTPRALSGAYSWGFKTNYVGTIFSP
ncbi:MAG: DUF11 domain-containing protein [Firmicutes bacterium]|nr:DUF11 domain-containing protein [Bacillota bacterium]